MKTSFVAQATGPVLRTYNGRPIASQSATRWVRREKQGLLSDGFILRCPFLAVNTSGERETAMRLKPRC